MADQLFELFCDSDEKELTFNNFQELTRKISDCTNRSKLIHGFQNLKSFCENSIKALENIPDTKYYSYLSLNGRHLNANGIAITDIPSVCLYTVFSFLFAKEFLSAKRCCRKWHHVLSQSLAESILNNLAVTSVEMENQLNIENANLMKFSLYFESEKVNERTTPLSWYSILNGLKNIYWTSSDLKQNIQHVNSELFNFTLGFFYSNIYQFDETINFVSRQTKYREELTDFVLLQREIKLDNPRYKVSEIYLGNVSFDLVKSVIPTYTGDGFFLFLRHQDQYELHEYYADSSEWFPLSQCFDPNQCKQDSDYKFSLFNQIKLTDSADFSRMLFSTSCPSDEIDFCVFFVKHCRYEEEKSIGVYRLISEEDKQTDYHLFSIELNKSENTKNIFITALRSIPIICVISKIRWRFYTMKGFYKEFEPKYKGTIFDVTLRNDNGNLLLFILVSKGIIKYRVRM